MDKVNRFFEFKKCWKHSSETGRADIDQQITELLSSMTDEEIKQLADGVQQDFDSIHQEVGEIKSQLTIRERLEPILPYLSVSNLAKDYFGKSSSWCYQRLNGNVIRGKVCRFTRDELETLNAALKEIGNNIGSLSIQY